MPLSGAALFFVVIAILLIIILFFYFVPIGLWVTAYFSGVRVKIFKDLVGMRLRKVPPPRIIRPIIAATKAGIKVNIDRMEAHYLAGGNVANVINALISADKASINLSFERATAIDLAGRDVLEAVKVYATLGEICGVWRKLWGEYREPVVF